MQHYVIEFVSDLQQVGTLCCVFVFLGLVYPMLPVSLESPFLIAPSVFSNVYFRENCIYLYDIHTLVSIQTTGGK
jgi:hypothetical protein